MTGRGVMRLFGTAVLLFAATPAIALAQPLVLSPVTLIDVREGTANPGMTVVITGNRITDVGSVDEIDVPDGTQSILAPER